MGAMAQNFQGLGGAMGAAGGIGKKIGQMGAPVQQALQGVGAQAAGAKGGGAGPAPGAGAGNGTAGAQVLPAVAGAAGAAAQPVQPQAQPQPLQPPGMAGAMGGIAGQLNPQLAMGRGVGSPFLRRMGVPQSMFPGMGGTAAGMGQPMGQAPPWTQAAQGAAPQQPQ
jgi:hypothetical protein